MKVIKTDLPEVLVLEPKVYGDDRGFFLETYHRQRYRDVGVDVDFVQDNHSKSAQGVLRGMHWQVARPQAKLVWCISGKIYDVAVDVRPGSPNFGKWTGVELDSDNKRQIYVPAGFAHGFCALSEGVQIIYKCSDLYDPSDEGGVIWNDPAIGIRWPISEPVLSTKDAVLPPLSAAKLPR
ncbi:MAG: dTDP-4-dehydrorhamnose 3,5-epimerase [Deltaproteobacteria bacterium]|nr:dTDP-4-dehydrorhamnose 3,5-epimerase [Deltaproteobacteria bacterium]